VLGRPAVIPIPRFGPRLLVGDLADELIYSSVRAVPERVLASGYEFAQPELEGALRAMLHRPKAA
jgi:NAD dependent epimerase/dehydratase family enzyme